MKLQIRKKEAWHTMLDFDAAQRFEVEDAAASLSRAAGGLPLRMLDDDGTVRHLNASGAFRNETYSWDAWRPAGGETIAQGAG
ncbi:MAG: hypothetical protein J0I77_09510 [Rudaea sp.]|uniref:hypothetical protein n=1 Tax=unclassified Rudaea TaxID=2627037 RepID=UPI0010F698A9|nr:MULTISPECIES: hypothetical protein [unclassified Rudaea]MBN8885944.1 hypothetical protein [Rudaea sp.]MBR0347052.1 hypothetical protein [Rudaea sp.]